MHIAFVRDSHGIDIIHEGLKVLYLRGFLGVQSRNKVDGYCKDRRREEE